MQYILHTMILSCPEFLAACDPMGPVHGGAIEGRSIAASENWSAIDVREVITLQINPQETVFAGAMSFRLERR